MLPRFDVSLLDQRRSDPGLPEEGRNAPVQEMNHADTESVPVVRRLRPFFSAANVGANRPADEAKGTISADAARLAQLASFRSFAKGLSPSQVCMAAAS